MKEEWIQPFKQVVNGDWVFLKGFTSTSRKPTEAFKFLFNEATPDKKNVLFVICITNFNGVRGFNMNSEAYSNHEEEKEFLLMEGFPIRVLGFDE